MIEASKHVRCAIYTRKSSEEGLEQSFNSLHAQREACEAYVLSQRHEGWQALPKEYDDGGFSGGNMERPGLKHLLADITAGRIDTVVVYKVDRLTRSLGDFARIVESFDSKGVSFVSVTQQFNTTSSMGRLTLNVLLSFAQFEREVTGERIRDKVAASKRKGMWMGGNIPLGYDLANRELTINPEEAKTVQSIFNAYLRLGSVTTLQQELEAAGVRSKRRTSATGRSFGDVVLTRGTLYHLLSNPIYLGKIAHKGQVYAGKHDAIVDPATWKATAQLLKENAVTRQRGRNLSSGRVLHGKLCTEDGTFYTPTHANKQGRRYFYYTLKKSSVNQAYRSIPAVELEEQIAWAAAAFLSDSLKVAESFSDCNVRDLKLVTANAAHHATVLQQAAESEKLALLGRLIYRVTLSEGQLRIALDRSSLVAQLSQGSGTNSLPLEVAAPFRLARRGSEVRLLLGNEQPQAIPSLVRAVTQARECYQRIVSGEVGTMRELAEAAGLSKHYTTEILKLAVLSPELTQAIFEGRHSPTLTVMRLIADLPSEWCRQCLPV